MHIAGFGEGLIKGRIVASNLNLPASFTTLVGGIKRTEGPINLPEPIDHYSRPAVMDCLPPPARRITRIAARLSSCPAELIEPVISKLELCSIFALFISPAAGPVLLDAIENSPAWAWLFRYSGDTSGFHRLKNVWVAFSQLALLQQRPIRTMIPNGGRDFDITPQFRDGHSTLPSAMRRTSVSHHQRIKATAEHLVNRLERGLVDAVIRLLEALVPTELPAICIILPTEPLDVLKEPKGTADGAADPEHWHFLRQCPTEDELARRAREVADIKYTAVEVVAFLPRLMKAGRLLREAQAAELHTLAGLYEKYPNAVRTPVLAPNTPRKNKKHIMDSLHRDSAYALTKPFRHARGSNGWYRFRHPHPTLIPYDWCLRLFKFMVQTYPIDGNRYPPDLLQDLGRANKGFSLICRHGSHDGKYERVTGSGNEISHIRDLRGACWLPSPEAEVSWLESFLRCVQWIISELPDHAAWFQENLSLPKGLETLQIPEKSSPRIMLDEADYWRFIESETPEVIAKQLCADAEVSGTDATYLPSLLALYLPKFPAPTAKQVSMHLAPGHHISVQQFVYEDTVRKVKNWIMNAVPVEPLHADGVTLVSDLDGPPPDDSHISAGGWDRAMTDYARWSAKPHWKCYICKQRNSVPHRTLSALCVACGNFNLAGSALSLPHNLNLAGKVAVVTGGRINLGYHTALRLLRCGACVIVTSRYPRDTARRYRGHFDWNAWKDRLAIVGADFRSANDAFRLVEVIKEIITSRWKRKLDILINNAAQTLTDSIETEERAVDEERLLEEQDRIFGETLVLGHLYKARVRGAAEGASVGGFLGPDRLTDAGPSPVESSTSVPAEQNLQLSAPTKESSWVQSLSQIPYQDVITAHSVNTFVPLILVRELLKLMADGKPATRSGSSGKTAGTKATGYIVNVSSREGIFEASRDSEAKRGRHVHTNMSKAGLNMITETEAATTWKNHGVAMNTVDPGYMSAAPELEDANGGERPIGWEDGAGRVLWPIAMGEQVGPVVWGRFLKHYGAVRVDVRFGRG